MAFARTAAIKRPHDFAPAGVASRHARSGGAKCAASSPSRQFAVAVAIEGDPSRRDQFDRRRRGRRIAARDGSSQRPSPAAMVSASAAKDHRPRPGSRQPRLAPERSRPRRRAAPCDSSMTGSGARCSAVIRPARPPPMMTAQPARVEIPSLIPPACVRRRGARDPRSQDRSSPRAASVSSAWRMLRSVILFMCGQRLQGRMNSSSGCCTATLSLIEHSVSSTTRARPMLRSHRPTSPRSIRRNPLPPRPRAGIPDAPER